MNIATHPPHKKNNLLCVHRTVGNSNQNPQGEQPWGGFRAQAEYDHPSFLTGSSRLFVNRQRYNQHSSTDWSWRPLRVTLARRGTGRPRANNSTPCVFD